MDITLSIRSTWYESMRGLEMSPYYIINIAFSGHSSRLSRVKVNSVW